MWAVNGPRYRSPDGADDAPFVVRPASGRKEGAVRRMFLTAALALLASAGSAMADGTVIRWDNVAGKAQDGVILDVAGITSSSRPFVTSGGRVIFNLNSGTISIYVKGLSHAKQFPTGASGPQPIGAYLGPVNNTKVGTIVCNSTSMGGVAPTAVDTTVFVLKDGTGSYQGFIDVPDGCRQYPEDTAFLLRTPPDFYALPGIFQAFGADRTIL